MADGRMAEAELRSSHNFGTQAKSPIFGTCRKVLTVSGNDDPSIQESKMSSYTIEGMQSPVTDIFSFMELSSTKRTPEKVKLDTLGVSTSRINSETGRMQSRNDSDGPKPPISRSVKIGKTQLRSPPKSNNVINLGIPSEDYICTSCVNSSGLKISFDSGQSSNNYTLYPSSETRIFIVSSSENVVGENLKQYNSTKANNWNSSSTLQISTDVDSICYLPSGKSLRFGDSPPPSFTSEEVHGISVFRYYASLIRTKDRLLALLTSVEHINSQPSKELIADIKYQASVFDDMADHVTSILAHIYNTQIITAFRERLRGSIQESLDFLCNVKWKSMSTKKGNLVSMMRKSFELHSVSACSISPITTAIAHCTNLFHCISDSWRLYHHGVILPRHKMSENYVSELPSLHRMQEKSNLNFYLDYKIFICDRLSPLYRDYFLKNPTAVNYFAIIESMKEVLIVSTAIISTNVHEFLFACRDRNIPRKSTFPVRCTIIRRKYSCSIIIVSKRESTNSKVWAIRSQGEDIGPIKISDFSDHVAKYKKFTGPNVHNDIMRFDELRRTEKYKFGVIYCIGGQTTEEEIFSNKLGCSGYDKLLGFLGQIVFLKDFKGYKGSLDKKDHLNGEKSLYRKFGSSEIMFHVSTLLPHSTSDPQQLQKKRHIGNDIVALVYIHGDGDFDPSWIKSKFLQIFIVVKEISMLCPHLESVQFRVEIISKAGMTEFGPPLLKPAIFTSYETLSVFIIKKLISAENAAYDSQPFLNLYRRTREDLFNEMLSTKAKYNSRYTDSSQDGQKCGPRMYEPIVLIDENCL